MLHPAPLHNPCVCVDEVKIELCGTHNKLSVPRNYEIVKTFYRISACVRCVRLWRLYVHQTYTHVRCTFTETLYVYGNVVSSTRE
jgi:hypothetical protein